MTDRRETIHIFLSRGPRQAKPFLDQLSDQQAQVSCVPVIETALWLKEENKQILNRIDDFDWIFFTSAKGVQFFYETLEEYGYSSQLIHDHKIATVGSGTEKKAGEFGLPVHFVPSTYDALHMGKEFLDIEQPKRVLLVKGERSRTELDERFTKHGIKYENMYVYRTILNEQVKDTVEDLVKNKSIDLLAFTSPSSIEAFLKLGKEMPEYIKELPCFCIGKTTEAYALEHHFSKTYVPQVYTLAGLAEKINSFLEEEYDGSSF